MEGNNHFSHEHPLSFFQSNDYDEDPKHYLCNICGLPILSAPSYTCSNNACKFFLHKPCAELPRQLEEPPCLHPIQLLNPHSLSLEPKSNGQNFSYKCRDCEFDIHPLVAVPVEIKTMHKNHYLHPLVAICREILCQCNGCGEEHKGFFFCCQECNFWIHQDCILLPSSVKLPSHSDFHFFLTYSLSYVHQLITPRCVICHGFMFSKIGLYFCFGDKLYAHVRCTMSNSEKLKTETRSVPEVIQLPDEGDTFPSLVIREEFLIPDHHQKLTIATYHKHPNLILHDDGISSSNNRDACNSVCDVCIRPINISSPFYRCLDCHFLAHNVCANPRSSFDVAFLREVKKASLCPEQSEWFFSSVFPCSSCHRPCNGFSYHTDYENISYFYDVECMAAPELMKHASHGQHVLCRTSRLPAKSNPFSCCSVKYLRSEFYRCVICDFCIHLRCALLPKKTHHKFDDHFLDLIMTLTHDDDQSIHEEEYYGCFCQVCERSIDQQYWYYSCGKCEQYFHINCIPSVGYLSRVKFGRSLDIPCHIHPLTLTRMLTVGRHERCGHCHQIIKGFVDDMAFHCFECNFWIHFSCARDSASSCATDDHKKSTQLKLYWEASERAKLLRDVIVNTE